jgi:hypothetical protein
MNNVHKLAALLLVGVSACSSLGQVDGHRVNLKLWDQAQDSIRNRASFELRCPAEQLDMRLIEVWDSPAIGNNGIPTTVGVEGCGYRAIFVRVNSALYAMDSVSGPDGGVQPAEIEQQ